MKLQSMRIIIMPPRSQYWQYFEKISNATARCRSCSKILKTCGNTTNLRLHVEKIHGILLSRKKCNTKVSKKSYRRHMKASTSSASVEVTENESDIEMNELEGNSAKSDTISRSETIKTFQPTLTSSFQNISEYTEMGARSVRLTNAILYMICKDSQPFQIVENDGFLNLMKVTVPLYKVPARHTFKRLLENKFQETENYFKNKFKTMNSCTFTTDVWTDTMQTRSFLGVTVHFSDNDKLETATLGVYELTERHTGEYISQMLLKTCTQWEIDTNKVLAVVTDSGANMIKAVDIAFGKKYHIPCFAHMLNLVAQQSVKKTDELPELIASVKEIVTWFKHSVVASDELRKEVDLKLIQDVSTRWNSTFYMIERFLKLRVAINNIINRHASAHPMITAKNLIDLTEVCDILRPVEVATREICGEKYVTSSKVIPLTRMLHIKICDLKPTQTIGTNLQRNILAEIKKRLQPTESVNILAVSTLLDPRFKNIHFQDALACSKAINTIKDLMTTAETQQITQNQQDVGDNEKENIDTQFNLWSDHYKLVQEIGNLQTQNETGMPSELRYYLKNPLSDLDQEPLKIWNHIIGSTYPNLRKIAIKYLSCVATSSASERLFSKAGLILSQQRNRLKGKLVSKLLFLQSLPKKFWEHGE